MSKERPRNIYKKELFILIKQQQVERIPKIYIYL